MRHGDVDERVNGITGDIVAAALEIPRSYGPGMLEWVYPEILARKLRKMGGHVATEVVAPVFFEGERLDGAFRLDMLVDDIVIVELKAVEELHPVHFSQLRSYLQLTGREVGLLMNFRSPRLKDGVHRVVARPFPGSPRPPPPRPSA